MHLKVGPLLLAVLVSMVVGCGDDDGGTGGDTGGGGGQLAGHTYLSLSVTVDGSDHALVVGTQIRLTIETASIGFSAGCNTAGGSLAIDGDRLVVDALQMTEMGCDDARFAQDDWLVSFMNADPTWALDAGSLSLTSGGTVIVFDDEEVANPDRTLVGTVWILESLITGDAVSSVPVGTAARVIFENARVSADTGCNGVGGEYAVDGSTLTIVQGPSTLIACPPAIVELEAALARVLDGAITFEIDGNVLRLRHPSSAGLDLRSS